MKALSLWEPWASLCALGAKKNETRGWPTSYRGLLAIHAAKKMDRESLAHCAEDPFAAALAEFRAMPPATDPAPRRPHIGYALPYGCILSVHRLVACHRTEDVRARNDLGLVERCFGNYEDGRFAWKLELVHRLATPIPFKGAQGLFEVPLVEVDGVWTLTTAAAPAAQLELPA